MWWPANVDVWKTSWTAAHGSCRSQHDKGEVYPKNIKAHPESIPQVHPADLSSMEEWTAENANSG